VYPDVAHVSHFTTTGPLTLYSLDHLYPDLDAIPPGQNVYFDLYLYNLGSEMTIPDVSVEITPVDTNSTPGSYSSASFPDIAPGESQVSDSYLALHIADDCPAGTPIHFNVAIKSGGIAYWQEEVVLLGYVGIEDDNPLIPTEFVLKQNWPNPFNPSTTISYDLPAASDVTLAVYDITGRTITTLKDTHQPAGNYAIQWDGTDDSGNPVSTGVYFCRMQAGATADGGVQYSKTIKMVYLK
jgi:hypothetical protein